MILVVFATPPENPFDVHLEKGIVAPHEGKLLLLAGMGVRAAERLATALAAHPEATGVLEFGGAAAVSGAGPGEYYSIARTFFPDGVPATAISPVAGLPRAAAVCGDEIYRGGGFAWSAAAGMPLLYTMETLSLHEVCRRRNLPFRSIRLVTDDGRGDLSKNYRAALAAARETTTVLIDAATLPLVAGSLSS